MNVCVHPFVNYYIKRTFVYQFLVYTLTDFSKMLTLANKKFNFQWVYMYLYPIANIPYVQKIWKKFQ